MNATTEDLSTDSNPTLRWVLIVSLLVGTILRVWGVPSWDLLGDEEFTYKYALHEPTHRGIFCAYFFLSHLSVLVFGETVFAVRAVSVVLGLLTLPVFYLLVKRGFGATAAVFATALLAVSPWHVELTQMARYYSAVFLLGTIHLLFFLRFLDSGRWAHLIYSALAGLAAVAFHFAAAILLVPAMMLSAWALFDSSLVRNARAMTLIRRIYPALLVVGGLFLLFYIPSVLGVWTRLMSWGTHGWAMIPLLVLNELSPALFVAVLLGLLCLRSKGHRTELVFVSVSVFAALAALAVAGSFMNMTPRYVFSLAPMFFVSAGVFCGILHERLMEKGWILSLSGLLLLAAAGSPMLVSYFIERASISPRKALEVVSTKAAPGALVVGNFGSPLVDLAGVERRKYPMAPHLHSEEWETYLSELVADGDEVWFTWDTTGDGLAPQLQRWLSDNASLEHEQRARRIDRRDRSISVWRFAPEIDPN